MSGGFDGADVADGREYRRCGLDADSRHGERVIEELFDFVGEDLALVSEFLDLCGEARGEEFDGLSTGDGHGLPSAVKIAFTSWTGSLRRATTPPGSSVTGQESRTGSSDHAPWRSGTQHA
jgi:hypothetical protein